MIQDEVSYCDVNGKHEWRLVYEKPAGGSVRRRWYCVHCRRIETT